MSWKHLHVLLILIKNHLNMNHQAVIIFSITPVKISQLVASLQASHQQFVFARLVTSCQQVWSKLLTTCSNLVDIVRLVTRLFQQGCYNHDTTILLQRCVVNLVTFLLTLSNNLAAKLVINRLSSSVAFYCICRRSWQNFSANVPRFNVFYFDLRSNVMVYDLII